MNPAYVPAMDFEWLLFIFFTIVGLADGLLAAWIFRVRRSRLSIIIFPVLGGSAAGYFNWFTLGYSAHGPWSLYLAYVAAGWMVGEMIVLPLFILLAIAKVPARNKKWIHQAGVAVLILGATVGIFGAVDGDRHEDVTRISITSPSVPRAYDGFKIAQISDTHIGPYYREPDLDLDLERAHAEGADMVAFTGDLIDDVRYMPEAADTFTREAGKFPEGIIYVWGNHEYYRGKDYIRSELIKTPVKLLENDNITIHRRGAPLYVAGVDFPWAKGNERTEEEEKMTEEAWKGIPKKAPVLFLAHHSDFIRNGMEKGAILTMTGHTHGTQVGFLGSPIWAPFTYTRGMYTDGKNKGYVSRGIGGWFPFRFGCSRELVIFTLHHKD